MRRTSIVYVGAALSAAWYAWWLEQRERKYHPDVTWVNVTRGIALTGFWSAIRVAVGVPPGTSQSGAWWTIRMVTRMFCATGVPVIGWELWAKGGRGRVLLALLRRFNGADQAKAAWEQGSRPNEGGN